MIFSKKLIKEYKRIFEPRYGRKLSNEEVQEGANNLVGFFETLIKIERRSKKK